VTLSGKANLEAPAQAELRPSCAGTSGVNRSTCPYKLALIGSTWALATSGRRLRRILKISNRTDRVGKNEKAVLTSSRILCTTDNRKICKLFEQGGPPVHFAASVSASVASGKVNILPSFFGGDSRRVTCPPIGLRKTPSAPSLFPSR
jgi:hypothetical protein